MKNNWLYELDENILNFLNSLRSKEKNYQFFPSANGATKAGKTISLGFSCFALKTYYITGLWEDLKEIEKRNWLNFINSFQDNNSKFPKNSFLDYCYIQEFEKEQRKKIIKNSAKFISTKIGYKKFEPPFQQMKTNIRAESKQAISSLIQVGSRNSLPYLDFPRNRSEIYKFLNDLDWNKPWSAGAQYAGICLFSKTQNETNPNVFDNLIQFSNKIVKKDTGGYYLQNTPDKKELINGAMKMISGFDWIDQEIHYPEKLIDLCLDTSPSSEGCDLVDIVYVLFMCLKQTDYKKREIINYFDEIINLIQLHYFKEKFGFSYFKNKSQTHYYGVNITRGKNLPDIHGTVLLTWALSMIIKTNNINLKWNILKP